MKTDWPALYDELQHCSDNADILKEWDFVDWFALTYKDESALTLEDMHFLEACRDLPKLLTRIRALEKVADAAQGIRCGRMGCCMNKNGIDAALAALRGMEK